MVGARSWWSNEGLLRVVHVAVLATACTFFPGVPAAQTKTVVVLADVSDSTPQARADYERYFKLVLDHMKGGDALLVGRIGKTPSAGPLVANPRRLQPCNPIAENCRVVERRHRQELTAAAEEFSAMLKATDDESPILEVLAMTPRLFQNFPAERKVLVMLSDMKEFTRGGLNFEGKAATDVGKRADEILTKIKRERGLPDLKGVQVYVAAARDKDRQRFKAVETFWTKYFREAEAVLKPERYGQDLQNFSAECPSGESCAKYFQSDRHLKR